MREAMDLTALLVGTILAFRVGPLVGAVVTAMANTSSEASRVIGGAIVFLGVGIAAAFAARVLERRVRLPGLNRVNRAGGAGVAAAWGAFLATLVLTLAVVLPMPPAVADSIEGSAIAGVLTDPEGIPQEVFTSLAGDRLVASMLELRRWVGERRVIVEPGSVVEIPAANAGDLDADPAAARELFDMVNLARVAAGVEPLAWSDALAEVAAGHAWEMYGNGYFSHESPLTGDVGDRLRRAGLVFVVAGENLALAGTVEDVHDGLMDSRGHRANIEAPSFRRLGVAVVVGPLGLMTVEVFTG